MATTRPLRTLELQAATGKGHISAASGMVLIDRWLYVVADDELHLGVFDLATSQPGRLVRLLEGELPEDREGRKATKPDFEVLVRLPAFAAYPHGALLALPSGSRPNRRSGASIALDASGRLAGQARPLDLSRFYGPLQDDFPDLNIEGAVILGGQLVLLQRGGKSRPHSALIYLPLAPLFHAIAAGAPNGQATLPSQIRLVDLGHIEGTPLAFTDAAALADGRIVFCAVAENSPDSYLDGPCLGAVVGIIGQAGQLQSLHPLEPTAKVEGIHAMPGQDRVELLLVTDADDVAIAASLLAADIPLR